MYIVHQFLKCYNYYLLHVVNTVVLPMKFGRIRNRVHGWLPWTQLMYTHTLIHMLTDWYIYSTHTHTLSYTHIHTRTPHTMGLTNELASRYSSQELGSCQALYNKLLALDPSASFKRNSHNCTAYYIIGTYVRNVCRTFAHTDLHTFRS